MTKQNPYKIFKGNLGLRMFQIARRASFAETPETLHCYREVFEMLCKVAEDTATDLSWIGDKARAQELREMVAQKTALFEEKEALFYKKQERLAR